jgi:hypothetical protein
MTTKDLPKMTKILEYVGYIWVWVETRDDLKLICQLNWRAHKERLDLIESWISHHRFPAQLRRKIWAP